jgi:hypothetical protein
MHIEIKSKTGIATKKELKSWFIEFSRDSWWK